MSTINIEGMSCQHCAALVTKTLEGMGLTKVKIDLGRSQASFCGEIDEATLNQAIEDAGYTYKGSSGK